MESSDYLPIQSPQYEELLEVFTHVVAKLNIVWPAENQTEQQKSKLDECFLRSKSLPPCRSLPFFPDLHTAVFHHIPLIHHSDYYGNVAGLSECGYRAMPRVEQMFAGYLSPGEASSLKAPVLPSSRCAQHQHWQARGIRQQVRLVRVCTLCQCYRRTKPTC